MRVQCGNTDARIGFAGGSQGGVGKIHGGGDAFRRDHVDCFAQCDV